MKEQDIMNNEHHMKILLTIMTKPNAMVSKHADSGEHFDCLARHFNGAGLLEVTHHRGSSSQSTTYRFTKYGQLVGAFLASADGENYPLYDIGSGLGDMDTMQDRATDMLTRLERTITDEESMAYYI